MLREGGTLTHHRRPTARSSVQRAKAPLPEPEHCHECAARAQELTKLGPLFDNGTLKMHLEAVLPLEASDKRWRVSETGRARGKIIVQVIQ